MISSNLTETDKNHLLELAIRIGAARNWKELTDTVLAAILRMTNICSVSWNEAGDYMRLVFCPSLGVEQAMVDSFIPIIQERLHRDHPMVMGTDWLRPGSKIVQRHDYISDRTFRNTGLYTDAYKYFQEFQQLWCPIYGSPEANLVITLGRDKSVYSEREIQIMKMVQRLLAPKCESMMKHGNTKETLAAMLEAFQERAGLIRVDASMKIIRQNHTAASLIDKYFEINPYSLRLPPAIIRLVKENWHQASRFPSCAGHKPKLVCQKEGGASLYADLIRDSSQDTRLILLRPSANEGQFNHHRWDDLTDTQIQTLHLLALGKSRSEVARQLGIKHSSVHTNVHNLCKELGYPSQDIPTLLIDFLREFH